MIQRFLFAILTIASSGCEASCETDTSVICKGGVSLVEVRSETVGTRDRDLSKLFGVHSLWWGTQDDLADAHGQVGAETIALLRAAGVTLIRYGGGANELDWRACIGDSGKRQAQRIVDWAGPMRCRFGLAEYEHLNLAIGASASWYIANVVGYEGRDDNLAVLTKAAGEMARAIVSYAGDRARYWELGNELERGRLKWPTRTIAQRGNAIAQSIAAADPAAHLVVPLLEYKPDWIHDQYAHNRELVRNFKTVASDYSLHVYYDNAPEGPSVANRLAVVSGTAQLLKQEGVANPALWITEHARWPAGRPGSPDWKSNWYQTGNFDAVLATADFIAGLTQIDLVEGAMWHGLRAGPWNFLLKDSGKIKAGLIAQLYGFLKPPGTLPVLQVKTISRVSAQPGGYALRATAFMEPQPAGPPVLLVWVINRAADTESVELDIQPLMAAKQIAVSRRSLVEGDDNRGTERASVTVETGSSKELPNKGRVMIKIPPRSVNIVELSPQIP